MLTIMFGVGLEIKYQKAQRNGNTWPGLYLWSMLLLFVDGLLHYFFVFEYDVLMSYAVTAVFVSFIVNHGTRWIKAAMWISGLIHLILVSFLFLLFINDRFSQGGFAHETTSVYLYGSYLEQIIFRMDHFWILRSEAIFILPMNVFLFLSGVLLMRSKVFSPSEHGKVIRRRLLKWGLFVGLPLNMLYLVPNDMFNWPVRYLFAPVLSLAYVAIIGWFQENGKLTFVFAYLEKIGKMALSCYMLQNILASIVFYGWGLSFGNKLNSIEVIAVWIGISLILAGFASLWFKRFQSGPVEFVWKRLSVFPMDKKAIQAPTKTEKF
ncbi:DUF418 domain-containing protein [Lentibacillus sp. CBA3610]|uniref:DUF418 domain-containing protein n=1 Tax=Lentibacillus sp. CBA3610 TaxID=2518176 RepID=UPI0020D2284F|nr:DUF418 domain-containing protein [Lentibacillus sp. CBA3610]